MDDQVHADPAGRYGSRKAVVDSFDRPSLQSQFRTATSGRVRCNNPASEDPTTTALVRTSWPTVLRNTRRSWLERSTGGIVPLCNPSHPSAVSIFTCRIMRLLHRRTDHAQATRQDRNSQTGSSREGLLVLRRTYLPTRPSRTRLGERIQLVRPMQPMPSPAKRRRKFWNNLVDVT